MPTPNHGLQRLTELERAQMQEPVARARDERHMRKVLALAAVGEIATGLALLLVPSLVGQLLMGQELTGVTIQLARVTGIALVGLGVACWPGTPLLGMLTYSSAVALYLGYVGLAGGPSGMLLWPAVAFHVTLSVLLTVTWWRSR